MRYDNRKLLFIIMISVVIFIGCSKYTRVTTNRADEEVKSLFYNDVEYLKDDISLHTDIIVKFYNKRKNWNTSNLGSILFKNADPEKFMRSDLEGRSFVVLFWRHWNWLKNRHLYNYGAHKKGYAQVLGDCSVKNCIFTGDDKYLNSAHAVVIHMQKKQLPKIRRRNLEQRWIFLNDESPINKFSFANKSILSWYDMSNVFNWTMTYRSDSDIPVPYGRTIPLSLPKIVDTDINAALQELVPHWQEKKLNNHIVVITSNCLKTRMKFIRRLQNYVKVDVFGHCSDVPENKYRCPGHFKADCMLPAKYLFYLVLENSKCSQYITEKVFQHAYSKGAIPVIMGPSVQDAEDFLPPNSFLHVENYKSIQKLTKHMTEISSSLMKISSYHAWRKHFAIANEHGYFKTKSYHLCRICEALNYNDVARKSYSENELKSYFNEHLLCDLSYGSRKIF